MMHPNTYTTHAATEHVAWLKRQPISRFNCMVRTALAFIGILIGLGVTMPDTASAQVTQPSYVRPSKGAPITIVPSVTASSVIATYTTSAIFDWSAFAGVVVTVNQSGAGTFSACRYGVNVKALGNTNTTVSDFFLLNVANNDYSANASQSWYIRVLPGYLRFAVGTYEAGPSGAPACSYKVTVTPLPFDYSGELVSTGVESDVQGGFEFTSTVSITSTYPYTRLQCFETDATGCRCAPVKNGAAGTPTILLNPANADGHYGGVVEITNWVGVLSCTGAMGIFQH